MIAAQRGLPAVSGPNPALVGIQFTRPNVAAAQFRRPNPAQGRAAGETRPTPAKKTWTMHLAHPYDGQLTACGAIRDRLNTIHRAGVTCGSCRRTSAYRLAKDSGPPAAQSGPPDGMMPPGYA